MPGPVQSPGTVFFGAKVSPRAYTSRMSDDKITKSSRPTLGVVGAVLAVASVWWWRRRRQAATLESEVNEETSPNEATSPDEATDVSPPLEPSASDEVAAPVEPIVEAPESTD